MQGVEAPMGFDGRDPKQGRQGSFCDFEYSWFCHYSSIKKEKMVYFVYMFKILMVTFVVLAVFLVPEIKTVSASTTCTILTKNLTNGDTNSTSGKQVTLLQDFLYSSGYLKVAPTGRYGNLTTVAVKKFQIAKKINSTGTVGPLTQAAIKKASCVIATTDTNIITTSQNISTTTTPVLETNLVRTPQTGIQLNIGDNYLIQWSGGVNQTSLNILLDDENNAGAGYISANIAGTDSYNWTVGNVFIAGKQTSVVPPGNYRVHIIDQPTYGSVFNIKSGIFSIKETPLFINTIMPSTATADGKTEVVLYGSGFTSLTRLNFSGAYSQVLVPQYVSPNGKLLWFYVPQYITPNQYQLSVYNDYSSFNNSSTSTPSNSAGIQII